MLANMIFQIFSNFEVTLIDNILLIHYQCIRRQFQTIYLIVAKDWRFWELDDIRSAKYLIRMKKENFVVLEYINNIFKINYES